MKLSEFSIQPRGPGLIDTWLWHQLAHTELGHLPVELYCEIGSLPTEGMAQRARELVIFASSHGTLLLDLVYGHYRYAEENNWLEYWNVPSGLVREMVLSQVESIILSVHEDLFASVYVNPRWDPEHKLSLDFDATITQVNGAPFQLEAGVLVPL